MSIFPIDPAMIVTTDELPGYRIVKSLGVAEGISAPFFPGLSPSVKEGILTETLREAFLDMLNKAAAQRAHAIVGLRYTAPSSGIILAYGTAVQVEPL